MRARGGVLLNTCAHCAIHVLRAYQGNGRAVESWLQIDFI